MKLTSPKILTFDEFWPYYLSLHQKMGTRWLHSLGTILAVVVLIITVWTRHWRYLAVVPLCGYGPAWASHFFIEKNRPATWQYPWWSLLADFKMLAQMLVEKI